MRKLSAIEKQVVTSLCKDSKTFSGLVSDLLDDLILIVNKEKNFVDVGFKENNTQNVIEGSTFLPVIDLIERIATVLSLLNYLESDYYIFKTKLAHFDPLMQVVGSETNLKLYKERPETFILTRFPDPALESEIIKNIEKFFFATQGLKEYYYNSFLTLDQKHQRKSHRLAIIAIIISILIGVSSIVINLYSQSKKNHPGQYKNRNHFHRNEKIENSIYSSPPIIMDTIKTQ